MDRIKPTSHIPTISVLTDRPAVSERQRRQKQEDKEKKKPQEKPVEEFSDVIQESESSIEKRSDKPERKGTQVDIQA